jgi:hypothetical protein
VRASFRQRGSCAVHEAKRSEVMVALMGPYHQATLGAPPDSDKTKMEQRQELRDGAALDGTREMGLQNLQYLSQSRGPLGLKKQIAETQRRRGSSHGAICCGVDDRPDQSVVARAPQPGLAAPVVEILFCPRRLKLVPGTHRNCGTDRG